MSIEITSDIQRPSNIALKGFQHLLKQYHSIVPSLSDCMNRLNAIKSDLVPIYSGIRAVGVALTVKTTASDIAPVIKALEFIRPGDMLVVDTHNSKNAAFWGEIVAIGAKRRERLSCG